MSNGLTPQSNAFLCNSIPSAAQLSNLAHPVLSSIAQLAFGRKYVEIQQTLTMQAIGFQHEERMAIIQAMYRLADGTKDAQTRHFMFEQIKDLYPR